MSVGTGVGVGIGVGAGVTVGTGVGVDVEVWVSANVAVMLCDAFTLVNVYDGLTVVGEPSIVKEAR